MQDCILKKKMFSANLMKNNKCKVKRSFGCLEISLNYFFLMYIYNVIFFLNVKFSFNSKVTKIKLTLLVCIVYHKKFQGYSAHG